MMLETRFGCIDVKLDSKMGAPCEFHRFPIDSVPFSDVIQASCDRKSIVQQWFYNITERSLQHLGSLPWLNSVL